MSSAIPNGSANDSVNDLTLFPHQQEAIDWIKTKKVALLALDMGLGKTGVVLRAAVELKVKSITVICPAIATGNWENEFKKWDATHLKRTITSYHQVSKLEMDSTDLLVLDEAHYLKNTEANRTKAILGKKGLVHRARLTWAVTGTPVMNHAGELWPILYTFNATPLKFDAFVSKFCELKRIRVGANHYPKIAGTKLSKTSELKELLRPIMFRKTQSEVMNELPKIHYDTITVPAGFVDWEADPLWARFAVPSDRSKELFDILKKERDILEHVLKNTAGTDEKAKALSTLEQGVGNLRKYIGLQKVKAVAELVDDELTNNMYEKIVIFAHHQAVIEKLGQLLKHHNPSYLYGKTPQAKREQNIEKFQRFSSYRVMLCNIQTAATAINLTASNQVLFVEQDWVPANNVQAAKRCHRIGQTKPVFVRFVSINGSIDTLVSETLKRKAKEISSFLSQDDPPPIKIHPLERLVERQEKAPEKIDLKLAVIDDKSASDPLDINALCQ